MSYYIYLYGMIIKSNFMDLNLADKSYKFVLILGVTVMFTGFSVQNNAKLKDRENNYKFIKGIDTIDSTSLIIGEEYKAQEFNNSINKTIKELKSTDYIKKDAQTILNGNIAEMEVKSGEINENRKPMTNLKLLSLKTKALLSTRETEVREFESDWNDGILLIVIGFAMSCLGFFTWRQKENAPAIISIK